MYIPQLYYGLFNAIDPSLTSLIRHFSARSDNHKLLADIQLTRLCAATLRDHSAALHGTLMQGSPVRGMS